MYINYFILVVRLRQSMRVIGLSDAHNISAVLASSLSTGGKGKDHIRDLLPGIWTGPLPASPLVFFLCRNID